MGAWIETQQDMQGGQTQTVAPRVGAWIETEVCLLPLCARESRPAWARGLKRQVERVNRETSCRAPRGRVD